MDSSGDPVPILDSSDNEKDMTGTLEEICKEQEKLKEEENDIEVKSDKNEDDAKDSINNNDETSKANSIDDQEEQDFQLLISDEEHVPQNNETDSDKKMKKRKRKI